MPRQNGGTFLTVTESNNGCFKATPKNELVATPTLPKAPVATISSTGEMLPNTRNKELNAAEQAVKDAQYGLDVAKTGEITSFGKLSRQELVNSAQKRLNAAQKRLNNAKQVRKGISPASPAPVSSEPVAAPVISTSSVSGVPNRSELDPAPKPFTIPNYISKNKYIDELQNAKKDLETVRKNYNSTTKNSIYRQKAVDDLAKALGKVKVYENAIRASQDDLVWAKSEYNARKQEVNASASENNSGGISPLRKELINAKKALKPSSGGRRTKRRGSKRSSHKRGGSYKKRNTRNKRNMSRRSRR
jgi:exonuclease VII small subunit